MAALLIGGALEGIDRLKKKRAGKRRSIVATSATHDDDPSSSTASHSPPPPPSFSSTNVARRKEGDHTTIRETDEAHEKEQVHEHGTTPDETTDAPPPYQAPPYELHRSDTLLESSLRGEDHAASGHPRALFPSDATASSSAHAADAGRRGRRPCRVGPDGRCACGRQERSPGAPLGETIRERRERRWKDMWRLNNPYFWGLVGVSLAR